MSDNRKSCPLRGGAPVSCEDELYLESTLNPANIETDLFAESHVPCHFFNPNSRQCVLFDIAENLRDVPQALAFLSMEVRQCLKPRIEFDNEDQYIMEIRKDKDVIYRNIVRAVTDTRSNDLNIKSRYVMSSYIAGDQVIRFERRCGNNSGAVLKLIEEACEDELLDFRPGKMKEV